jgi:hypothetical protein
VVDAVGHEVAVALELELRLGRGVGQRRFQVPQFLIGPAAGQLDRAKGVD